MKKYITSILIIALLLASITSVTYAWFTYVEKKSLATFEAGVLSVQLYADQFHVTEDIQLDDLAFIDYQNDFVNNQNDSLNYMASSHRLDILLDEQSPMAKAYVTFTIPEGQEGLIYLVIYEGLNIGENAITSDYYAIVSSIISGYSTKAEQLAAVDAYNQNVIDNIASQEFSVSDQLTFQLVVWGDYDALSSPETYLTDTYYMNMNITMVNSKGAIDNG